MTTMTIDMDYYYKGSSNICLTLIKDEDDFIHCVNDYGEEMNTVWSGKTLGAFIVDLANGEYA